MFAIKILLLVTLSSMLMNGHAAAHKIRMLNSGTEGYMLFEPPILSVELGDTVTFEATDLSHNSASIEGMIPEGAVPWDGNLNQDVTITLDTPGIYVYQCTPHAMMAMVGVINVGESKQNLSTVKQAAALKKRSFVTNKDRLDQYLSRL